MNTMVDRRVIAHSAKHSFKVRVRTAGLRAGNHLFSVRARDASKRTTRKTVRFRVCR